MAVYIDFDYSMEQNMYGDIELKEDAYAVRQSMIDIILTKVGERGEYEPEYGSRVFNFLMEKINPIFASMIGDEIETALTNWEPRIRLTKIEVVPKPDDNHYDITIHYNLIRLTESDVLNLQMQKIG